MSISMPALAHDATPIDIVTSCGTLVFNSQGDLLLCHVTGARHWDIPKGMREPGESSFEAARRELQEETGLEPDGSLFEDLGCFDYVKHKRLHLFRLRTPACLSLLDGLVCTSHFRHPVTGKPTPEMDAYAWASREDIPSLCLLPMARQLLALEWP